MTVLTLMQLVKMVVSSRGSHKVVNDLPEVWKGFLPRQFFTFFLGCVGFFVLMYFVGFYLSAIIIW